MKITAEVSSQVENATLIDYFPNDWTVTDANGGIVSINKIEWNVGAVSDSVSKSYVIWSPWLAIPPVAYFRSELTYEGGNATSDNWRVILAGIGKIELLSKRFHFQLNEEPEFRFRYKKSNPFSTWRNMNLTVQIVGFDGQVFTISPDFIFENDDEFLVKLKRLREFRPGIYKIILKIEEDGETLEFEQDFSWGVLAINVNKSIYLPNETAYIQMAALRDDGQTIWDANLWLEIITPSGIIVGPEVENSGNSGPNNVTDEPDYFAYYQVGGAGIYQIKLTNLDTGYKIEDSFEVRDWVPFDVERIGPTRIYPPVAYEMIFRIETNQDFVGQVVEQVPASFEIISHGLSQIITQNDTKEIVWQVNWKAGGTYELKYQFDAPDISPYLYLLGPLEIGNFKEIRQWQIAADSPGSTDLQIGANDRDAWDDSASGSLDSCPFGDSTWQDAGGYQWSLPIPKDSIIENAYVSVYSTTHGGATGAYTARIRVENVDNAAAFNGAADNIYNRTYWTTTVDWSIPENGLPTGQYSNSPSIKDLVQHIVNRGGWTENNYICIAIWGQTSAGGANEVIYDFSANPDNAAKLHVEYTPPPTKPVLVSPENGTQTSDNTPTFVWQIGSLDTRRITTIGEFGQ